LEKPHEGIGLALSGGGFRAALFHLGVIRCLYDHNLLKQVRVITSVSGGSVLAAHLALNWHRYTGTPEEFANAANEVIQFTRLDVRGRIVRRWLCGTLLILPRLLKLLTFNSLLEKNYAELYKNATLRDLKRPSTPAGPTPDFHILATSLTTGELCKFTRSGFTTVDRDGAERLTAIHSLPLSKAVAASSAFPPLFPPVEISRQLLGANARHFDKTQYLCDGGIHDNLGLEELRRITLAAPLNLAKKLLVSDAGGNFDWAIGNRFSSIVPRNVRATEILMNRVSRLVKSLHSGLASQHAHMPIGRVLPTNTAHAMSPEIQRSVPNIRTDMDSFTSQEIEALQRHGYAVASDQLYHDKFVPDRLAKVTWELLKARSSLNPKELEIEDTKRQKLRLLSWSDPASWLLAALILFWLSIPVLTLLIYHFYLSSKHW
jgi:predicted acylesterase/phospholipase RssA